MAANATKDKKQSRCRNYDPDLVKPTERELAKFSPEDAELLMRAMTEPVEYIDHPTFRNRGTEKALFGEDPGAIRLDAGHFAPMPTFVTDSDIEAVERVSVATLTAQQEQKLFQRFNFARCKVFRIVKAHKAKKLPISQMRQLLMWFKIANAARAQIVQANLPLVLAMAKRTKLTGVDFSELISEGNMALLRSVDKFDCSKGLQVQHLRLPGDPEVVQPGRDPFEPLSQPVPDGVRPRSRKERLHRKEASGGRGILCG